MITCVGMRNNRYLIRESEPDVVLQFGGEDGDRFEQVDVPTGNQTKRIKFSLTEDYLRKEFPGFLSGAESSVPGPSISRSRLHEHATIPGARSGKKKKTSMQKPKSTEIERLFGEELPLSMTTYTTVFRTANDEMIEYMKQTAHCEERHGAHVYAIGNGFAIADGPLSDTQLDKLTAVFEATTA